MAENLTPQVKAHPLISQWVSFDAEGGVHVLSGRVELGQGIATALTQIAADELDVPISAIRLTQGHTGISPAEGATVGSLSVSFGGLSVRLASSAARVVFLDHAAGLLQALPAELEVAEGLFLKNGLDTGLSYAELAQAVDLEQPIADFAAPKAATKRQFAGTSLPRIDLAARLGGAPFLHDMTLDGMLHGRVVQPPFLEAELGDLDGITLAPGAELVRDGRFIAVVAEREYTAVQEAARLADIIPWEGVRPALAHPIEELDGDIKESETIISTGDPTAGGTEISLTLTKPVLSHGSIGPSCSLATWNGGNLKIWAHSQNVFALRGSLSRVLGVSPEHVEVIFAPGAGCYGHNSSDDAALDAALMSRLSGRPVRALWTRRNEFQHAPLSPAMKTRVTARLNGDGNIVAYDALVISPPHSTRPGGAEQPNVRSSQFLSNPIPMGPGDDAPQPQGGADRNATPGYNFPAVHVVRSRPEVVPYRYSAMRSLGAFNNTIALELLMEECAEAAGVDSIDYRLAHLDDPRAAEVIRKVHDMAGDWSEMEGTGYGLGYSRYKNSSGYLACIARVEVADEVRVTDVWSAGDIGEVINPDGTINQIDGGTLQAISWTLKEEIAFSGGVNLTEGWDDYPILPFSEVPRMHTKLIDRPDAPLLGAGEISSGPAGAAVVIAVRAALGVTPDRLPLTRHALVSMLS